MQEWTLWQHQCLTVVLANVVYEDLGVPCALRVKQTEICSFSHTIGISGGEGALGTGPCAEIKEDMRTWRMASCCPWRTYKLGREGEHLNNLKSIISAKIKKSINMKEYLEWCRSLCGNREKEQGCGRKVSYLHRSIQENLLTVVSKLSSIYYLEAPRSKVMLPNALLLESSQVWPLAWLRIYQMLWDPLA